MSELESIGKMYHYTTLDRYEYMVTGLYKCEKVVPGGDYPTHVCCTSQPLGLRPLSPLFPDGTGGVDISRKDASYKGAWGFLEPDASSWFMSSEFPEVFKRLMIHLSWCGSDIPAVVEVNLQKHHEPFVLDWAHIERDNYVFDSSVVDRYLESRVKFQNYDGSYDLPEVVVTRPIEPENLSLHTTYDPEVTNSIFLGWDDLCALPDSPFSESRC